MVVHPERLHVEGLKDILHMYIIFDRYALAFNLGIERFFGRQFGFGESRLDIHVIIRVYAFLQE